MQTVLVADEERTFKALEGTCLRREVCRLVKATPGRLVETAAADPPDLIIVPLSRRGSPAALEMERALAGLGRIRSLAAVPIIALDYSGRSGTAAAEGSGVPGLPGLVERLAMKSGPGAALDSRLDEAIQRHLPALRRKIDRVAVSLPVQCRRRGAAFTLHTKNISPTGLFLKTERALAPGERIRVRFALPVTAPQGEKVRPAATRKTPRRSPVSATCLVVRRVGRDDDNDLIPGVGVRFLDLDNDVRGALRHFVRRGAKASHATH